MMMFNKISLKILLPLIAIFVMSFLGITLFVVQSQARFAREQLIKNARVSAQAILSSSLDLFIEKAVYDIQFVLVNAKKANEDIEYIAIVDTHGKALAHTEVLLIDTMLTRTAFDRAALTFSALTVREIPETRDVFEVCMPMLALGSEKEMLGVLRIGINQHTIHTKIAHIRRNIIGVGIVAVLISILLFTGIVEIVVNKPMKLLTRGAEQVSAGNLDIAIPVRSRDEIGYFSDMFNQMAQHLKHSQHNYRTLVDNLNVGVYRNTTGPHGQFLRVNPALVHIFGYDSPDELMRKRVSDLYRNPAQRQDFIAEMEQHGTVRNMELAMQKKDGEPIWVSVSANAVYDDEGNITWMDGIVEDITKKKHAEKALQESERKYRAIFEESNDMIFITTPEGRVIDVSPACESLLGYTRQEGLQLNALAVYANHNDRTRFQEIIAQQGFVKDFEVVMQRKDGGTVETSLTATVRRADDGTILGYQGIVRDMTAQKQAEAARRASEAARRASEAARRASEAERLQAITLRQEKERAEIARRAAEDAQRAADAANQAKTIFLANMSHELRTPLNGVLGYARILGHDSSLTPKQADAVEIILRNGEHLLLLLEDILDFSKIETNQLELHPAEFVLPRMLCHIMQIIRIHAQEKRLSFQYEASPELPQVVYGDEKRLRQILLNLLGNAVKFTEHGTVTFKILDVRFKISEKEDIVQSKISHLKFQIQDTGIGIAPEQIEKIFQPFWQPGTYLLHSEGTGLGLATSQWLAEKMGSQIHIASTVGQGTTCWFELELPVIAVTTGEKLPQQPERLATLPSQGHLIRSLNTLPSQWLATLRQGTEDVDFDTLSEVLERIGERDPMLADALTRLRDEFEYDEILQLIHQAHEGDM